MKRKITIDPITRIEGHLKVDVEVENNVVVEAKCSGTLYRGIEQILIGRDPRDACQIAQRICGVCPIAHGMTSSMCLESAFGISDKISSNAWLVRNLIHVSQHIHNSILHFYHLCLLDYLDVTKVKRGMSSEIDLLCNFLSRDEKYPFVPRDGEYRLPDDVNARMVQNYLKALELRRTAHEMLAIFGGKMPHQAGIIPGGVTQGIDVGKIEACLGKIKDLKEFINFYLWQDIKDIAKYYPDYWEIGKGCKNFLAYGAFPIKTENGFEKFQPSGVITDGFNLEELDSKNIMESIEHSWYKGGNSNPAENFPEPDFSKQQGYSWLKSPRYKGKVCEVGPLARMLVAYLKEKQPWKSAIDKAMNEVGITKEKMVSTMGRNFARAIETKVFVGEIEKWLLSVDIQQPFYYEYQIPQESSGIGLSEGARGAVGHWIKIKDKKISHYQVISPTTWNASPRDEKGNPGPMEQALLGTMVKDEENPVEVLRIVRSFDPCLACSVQIIDKNRLKVKELVIWG